MVCKLIASVSRLLIFRTTYFRLCSEFDYPTLSLNIHQNIVSLDLKRQHIHTLARRILRQPRLHVERPRVPRTHHRIALKPALSQRSLPMWTHIVQRRQLPIHIGQTNHNAIHLPIVATLLCGYLTYCLLFYQGQWQLVLHPTRTAASPASIDGISYELVRFGPDESATPQLTGWWIPAASGSRFSSITILFLPDGNGSLVNSIPTLASLHNLGLNVFAFDYRTYAQSAPARPSQQSMTQAAEPTLTGALTSPSEARYNQTLTRVRDQNAASAPVPAAAPVP